MSNFDQNPAAPGALGGAIAEVMWACALTCYAYTITWLPALA